MPKQTRPEILSPAGDFEKLKFAVRYGADAVYLAGKDYGMRSACRNFTRDEMEKAVKFCHGSGVKAYVAVNTLPREEDLAALPEYLDFLNAIGADALIVADLGVMALCRKIIPKMKLHVSTQAGVVNRLAAGELYRLGAGRVVLAREVSLEEIAAIRRGTPEDLELEAFVHGAMCVSFSGRCLISNYLAGRDANRGMCAQPCRWKYYLSEEKRPGRYFPVEEDSHGTYFFNSRDLCMIEHLDKLADAGVTSFKIEGRAKSFYYAAAVTNAYRAAEDCLFDPAGYNPPRWAVDEVYKVSHRGYCTGFYLGDINGGIYDDPGYIRRWDVAAVAEFWRGNTLVLSQRNRFFKGDELEVVPPLKKPWTLKVEEIRDLDGSVLNCASHPMQLLKIPCERAVEPGTVLRRRLEPDDEPGAAPSKFTDC